MKSSRLLTLIICILCLGLFATGISAADSVKLNYVFFGDSTANGYGTEGYKLDWNYAYKVQNEEYPATKSTFYQFGRYLKDAYGESNVNESNYCLNSYRLIELYTLLMGDAEIDGKDLITYLGELKASDGERCYTDSNGYYFDDYNTVNIYNFFEQDFSTTEGITTWAGAQEYFRDEIKNADVLCLDYGNTMGNYLAQHINYSYLGSTWVGSSQDTAEDLDALLCDVYGADYKTTWDEYTDVQDSLKTYRTLISFAKSQGIADESMISMVENIIDLIEYIYLANCAYYDLVIDYILEVNPDVEIITVGGYNNADGVFVSLDTGSLNLGLVYGSIIDGINQHYQEKMTDAGAANPDAVCKYAENFTYESEDGLWDYTCTSNIKIFVQELADQGTYRSDVTKGTPISDSFRNHIIKGLYDLAEDYAGTDLGTQFATSVSGYASSVLANLSMDTTGLTFEDDITYSNVQEAYEWANNAENWSGETLSYVLGTKQETVTDVSAWLQDNSNANYQTIYQNRDKLVIWYLFDQSFMTSVEQAAAYTTIDVAGAMEFLSLDATTMATQFAAVLTDFDDTANDSYTGVKSIYHLFIRFIMADGIGGHPNEAGCTEKYENIKAVFDPIAGKKIEQVNATNCTETGTKAYYVKYGSTDDIWYSSRTCTESDLISDHSSWIIPAEHTWDNGVVTKAATTTTEGVMTYTCTRCKATKTEVIPKLVQKFTDVPAGEYYTEPVAWAVEKEITTGISETLFGPNELCTRCQFVTFLWRAAGKPIITDTTNPFVDIYETDYYYNAVLWAVANGITIGVDATHFNPEGKCTRAQVVTFIWRAAEEPQSTATNPFTDLEIGEYYYNAVLWAVGANITSGITPTTFKPDDICTRAQVVTFLYRFYNQNI